MSKKRKTPERKCIVTNEMKPKKDLIRVVRNKEGEISVDPTGKKNGRGAYLSKDTSVIEKAKETHILERTFNTEVSQEIFTELQEITAGESNEK